MTEFKVIGVDLHPATEVGIARITYILFKIPGIKCVSDSLMPVFKLSIYLANSIYLRYGLEPELLGHFSLLHKHNPAARGVYIGLSLELIPPKPWPSVVKLLDQGKNLWMKFTHLKFFELDVKPIIFRLDVIGRLSSDLSTTISSSSVELSYDLWMTVLTIIIDYSEWNEIFFLHVVFFSNLAGGNIMYIRNCLIIFSN